MTTADRSASISTWRIAAGILQGAFYLGYPVVVYLAHTRLPTRSVGGLLLALYVVSLAVRVGGSAGEFWSVLRQHMALALLIVVAIVLDDRRLLLLLPTLVSFYLFVTFSLSLRNGPPMIERFARAVEDDLPPFTFPYCRKVTLIWSVFLAANTLVVTILAYMAPLAWWALYTGGIFYVLLGVLVGGEYCFRKWWFRYYGAGFVDGILARLLPAERTEVGRRSLAYVERRRARESDARKRNAGTPATY